MSRRREHPLPKLPISLEDLPATRSKRSRRFMVSFTEDEFALIQRTAVERGEQPAVLCRTIVLTAFQNSAARALATQPGLLAQPGRAGAAPPGAFRDQRIAAVGAPGGGRAGSLRESHRSCGGVPAHLKVSPVLTERERGRLLARSRPVGLAAWLIPRRRPGLLP